MGSKPSTAKPEGGSSSSSSSGGQVEFYWDPVSPPSRCVHMTLMALGEKFVAKHLDLFKGEHKTEEYLKINPAGKVPAIKCGDFTLSESRAIAMYLCNKYKTSASAKLYPTAPEARAQVDRLLLLSDEVMSSIMKQIKLFSVMFGGEKPDESQLSEAAKGVTACSKLLGDKKFIAGNNVTIADFFMATPFMLYEMATDEKMQTEFYGHEGGATVQKWLKNLRSLPYYDEVNKDANAKLGGLYKAKVEESQAF